VIRGEGGRQRGPHIITSIAEPVQQHHRWSAVAAYPHVDRNAVGFYLAHLEASGKWDLIDETHLRSSRF
jgi:hypothetical protein